MDDKFLLTDVPARIGEQVFNELVADLRRQKPDRIVLVADENTFHTCGQMVEEAVSKARVPIEKVIFPGKPWLAADESSIARVLNSLNGQENILLAVGSGTITDVVRFVAFQARLPFISIPTAASVDSYASFTAAMTFGQVKYSIPAKPAQAIYAHLPTLCAAPARLNVSGFSDMVAKYTALADWQLAHLLAGDAYNAAVSWQAEQAVRTCIQNAEAIRAAQPAGLTALFNGLLISGRCMVTVNSSRPAAGAEHSLAHYWEIQHQLNHQHATLHGEKTGVATVLIAQLYEELRRLSLEEVIYRLDQFRLPDPAVEGERLQASLGPVAAQMIANRPSFLGKLRGEVEQIKVNLVTHWDQIQAVALKVPTGSEIAGLLEKVGSPSRPDQLQVQPDEVQQALKNALYVRDRLTILELNYMLGLSCMDQALL